MMLLQKAKYIESLITITLSCDSQECILEEVPDEEEAPAPTKSSKDKKANGPDVAKALNLVFKITSRVPYKTVLKGTLYISEIVCFSVVCFSILKCSEEIYNWLQHTALLS